MAAYDKPIIHSLFAVKIFDKEQQRNVFLTVHHELTIH